MDITSVGGFGFTAVLLFFAIGPSNIGNFIDTSSILIVVAGTIAALVISYPISVLKQIPNHLKVMMNESTWDPMKYILDLEEMATMARKNGLLALEEKAATIEDPFMKEGIMLIVDATAPEKVKEYLETGLDNMHNRHSAASAFYSKGAEYAPGLGMIGTLMGLINMLAGLDLTAGPGNLTGDMAVAMITTFYGSALANLVFLPISNKIGLKNDDEVLCKEIIIEGILAIQEGENPKFLKDKLLAYLPQYQKEAANGAAPAGE